MSGGCLVAWLGQGPHALKEGWGFPTQPQPGFPPSLFCPGYLQSPVGTGTWQAGDQALTEAGAHAPGDLQEDACVAADHDEQRQQEEASKAKHVVEGLVPGLGEAAPRGALGEVVWGAEGDRVEEEQLEIEQRWDGGLFAGATG